MNINTPRIFTPTTAKMNGKLSSDEDGEAINTIPIDIKIVFKRYFLNIKLTSPLSYFEMLI